MLTAAANVKDICGDVNGDKCLTKKYIVMKKVFLLMLFMVTVVVTMNAQDEPQEQTAMPIITIQDCETYTLVTIENSNVEPYAEIYYSISNDGVYNDGEYVYDWPLTFQWAGFYYISAYAKAPDKLASETVTCRFFVPQYIEYVLAYDFIVDGIYYRIKTDSTVWVSTMAIGTCSNDYEYVPEAEVPCYSGDVMIPGSVEYNGETYIVTGIADCAFEGCDLGNVSLPNTIETICDHAFHDCTGLTTITIPESVTDIGQNVFWWCVDLKRVVCKAVTPPHAVWTAFWYNFERATLFVPAEALEAYSTHTVWSRFTHIVPFIGAGPGDTNGDGTINITDVTNLINQLLGSDELPAWSDVDGDGSVTIKDVTSLIEMLLNGD